ncbi:MAG: hypothetical protein ACHRHE_09515 [Tepidisphaerales bacterium]
MSEVFSTLEEATAALASTAERAAILIRTESARAKEEAARMRHELDTLRTEVQAAKNEFEGIRSTLLQQDDEKERVRRSAGWAWSAVGVMAACMMLAIGWTATQLTRGQTVVGNLNTELSQAKAAIQQRDTQLSGLRQEIESARIAQARAEVELQVLFENPVVPEKPVNIPVVPDKSIDNPAPEKPANLPAAEIPVNTPKPADTTISTADDADPLAPR